MRSICMEVAGLLEEVATSGDEPDDEATERRSCAQRFISAVQASLAAAEALGISTDDDPTK